MLKKRTKITFIYIIIIALIALLGCAYHPQITGTATIIDFNTRRPARNSSAVHLEIVVIGYTGEGLRAVRHWRVTPEQFREFQIGDNVKWLDGRVVLCVEDG